MCGIAGVINKKKTVNVGEQMSLMLQGIKHRGPDSTGYAMYGKPKKDGFILRFKVSENVAEQSSSKAEDPEVLKDRKKQVDAAKQWAVDDHECHAENHYVVHSSGKKISFGNLVEQARKIATPIDSEIILKDKKDFKYIGKGLPSIDMNDFMRGTAIFGLDARIKISCYEDAIQ